MDNFAKQLKDVLEKALEKVCEGHKYVTVEELFE